MKFKQLFLFAVMLTVLALALTACELPFDLPFGGEETTAPDTTTDPAATTSGAIITLPPATAAPNPIAEVNKVSGGLQLVHKKNATVTRIEAMLDATDDYYGVTYTHAFDKESGILTLTLSADFDKDNAFSPLFADLTTMTVCLRENNKKLEWAYKGSEKWTVLCRTGNTGDKPLTLLQAATGFGAKTVLLENRLAAGAGYNDITYTHAFNETNNTLTLTLLDKTAESNPLYKLTGTRPASLAISLRKNGDNLEWAYEGSDDWKVLTEISNTSASPLALLREATDFAKKTLLIEDQLAAGNGHNGVVYTASFDEETGILTMALFDSVIDNIALSHLDKELPLPLAVCLRKNGDNIEWAYKNSNTWTFLCGAADTTAKPLALLRAATNFAKTELPTGEGVTFVISGNNLRFRAHNWQKEGYDFCNDAHLHSAATDNFLLNRLVEISSTLPDGAMDAGTLFKGAGDEICAISINGTWIAGAHGYYCISSVPNSASFTEADIGRVFTRKSDGQKYVLVKVPSTVWFCPFDEEAMESGNFTQYGFPAKGLLQANDVLIYEVDGKEKTFTVSQNATQEQFRFPSNHRVQHAYLNGTVEVDLTKDGVYNAEFVDFYERYDVVYLPTVLEYLMDNVGKNTNASHYDESIEDSYLTYFQTHRFHNNGSYTVYQTIRFNSNVKNVSYYGVMSGAFGGESQYVYAPGSENCGTPAYDEKGDDFYAEGDYTIRSFYHSPNATFQKGINVGYYPYFGVATDEIRQEMVDRFGSVGEWYSSMKMYPHLYKAPTMSAGDEISFIGYHCPTTRFDDDFFAINHYFVDDEIYLSMHTDKAVAEKTVSIPNAEYLTGLSISIEEASEGFTVHSTEVGADGIRVSTTGAGYVTLKLTAK